MPCHGTEDGVGGSGFSLGGGGLLCSLLSLWPCVSRSAALSEAFQHCQGMAPVVRRSRGESQTSLLLFLCLLVPCVCACALSKCSTEGGVRGIVRGYLEHQLAVRTYGGMEVQVRRADRELCSLTSEHNALWSSHWLMKRNARQPHRSLRPSPHPPLPAPLTHSLRPLPPLTPLPLSSSPPPLPPLPLSPLPT